MTGSAADPYTLADLQGYLNQFPPTHYSHGGREPLLFAIVLLLSVQPRGLLAFLAQARLQQWALSRPPAMTGPGVCDASMTTPIFCAKVMRVIRPHMSGISIDWHVGG